MVQLIVLTPDDLKSLEQGEILIGARKRSKAMKLSDEVLITLIICTTLILAIALTGIFIVFG